MWSGLTQAEFGGLRVMDSSLWSNGSWLDMKLNETDLKENERVDAGREVQMVVSKGSGGALGPYAAPAEGPPLWF